MRRKYVIGLVVSLVFIYFSIRGLAIDKILEGLKDVKYFYLLPAVSLFLSLSVLRSLRWGIILSLIKRIDQKELFPIFCIGFMAVILLPMRIGELVRPYLLSTNKMMAFSLSLGTIFVERVLDILTILTIFFVVFLSSPLPYWLIKSGYYVFLSFIAMIIFMCYLYFRTESALKLLAPFIKRLPNRFQKIIGESVHNFVDGFKIISSPKKLISTLGLSVLLWVTSGFAIYSLFYFHGMQLSLLAAFVILLINVIGLSLPTGPGMLGNFQLSCIVALSLFDITKEHAFVFSMVYYFLGVGIIILLGLMSIPFLNFSFKDAFKKINKSFLNS